MCSLFWRGGGLEKGDRIMREYSGNILCQVKRVCVFRC